MWQLFGIDTRPQDTIGYWDEQNRRFTDRAPEERNITVYTNCDKVTLYVNEQEVETKEAVDHAVVFENVVLQDGENEITAKAGIVEDTIILNGVAEHNPEYTLTYHGGALAK